MIAMSAGPLESIGPIGLSASPSLAAAPAAAIYPGSVHDTLTAMLPHALAVPHAGALVLALLTGGALWTAVDFPTTTGRLPGRRLMAAVLFAILLAAAPFVTVALAVGLSSSGSSVARWLTIVALMICCGASLIGLALGWDLVARLGLSQRPVLVLGNSSDWADIRARLAPGYDPAFRVTCVTPVGERPNIVGNPRQRPKIWGVVASDNVGLAGTELSKHCHRAGVRLLGEEEFRERWSRRVDLDRLRPGMLAAAGARTGGWAGEAARRATDIVLGVLLLVFTLPLWALAAVLIKLDSSGPVFYRQERVGLHGKPFRLLKFRSMRADAEAQSGPQWANPADPRVTRIGALLRLSRIDELPQLWNVLRGEMSIIGPRPERPYFVAQLAAELSCYDDRSLVKPGITGWAQVNYRYGASIDDARTKLAYDLYYVKHRSFLLDLRILAATVRVVLLQQGAR